MTIVDGDLQEDSTEDILAAMMADAKEYFGEDLNDTSLAIIRQFYRPIATRLSETQEDIGLVLDSAQIDNAEGTALDLLTALIGITRNPAEQATGQVTFSRDTAAGNDYLIPAGTEVQTDASNPVKFTTDSTVTLSSGNTSVQANITAAEGGPDGNVGSNTLTIMPDPPTGIEEVTNSAATSGGANEENDEELRDRAKSELGEGARASAPALVQAVQSLGGVTSVSIFVNDTSTDNTGSGGLPDHSFELVVSGGNDVEVAQAILDTKAAGDTSYGGANGTKVSASADLPNGQSMTIDFSEPTQVQIYVNMDLEVTDEYGGDDAVRDRIVDYIGGIFSSGQDHDGLGVGEDVIYGEIEYAIRDVDGVYDVTTLEVGTSANPSGTSNVAIANSEASTSDATDGSLTISTTQV